MHKKENSPKILLERLLKRFYGDKEHPYKIYEKTILKYLGDDSVVLDAGCGHAGPVISKIANKCRTAI